MNTSINFETAKLLKEKDIIINSVFAGHGYHWYLKGEKDEFGDPLDNGTGVWKLANFNTHTKEEYYAPTVDEVKWWLYEKHEIWVVVNIAIDNLWYFELYNLKDKRNAEIPINDESFYTTPSEAYQEAINYTLKNLIK